MLKRFASSLYLKLFLSFLAVCVLLFLGLALFWNSYFNGLFYKDKKTVLESRSADLEQVITSLNNGTMSSRELRFSLRLLSRSFNGEIWVVDSQGTLLYGTSPDQEGHPLPREMEDSLLEAGSKEQPVYFMSRILTGPNKKPLNFLTYALPVTIQNQKGQALFLAPVDDILDVIATVRANIWTPLLFAFGAVALILFFISRKLAGPLREMNRAALAIAEGDFSMRVPEGPRDEVGQLAVSFNQMIDKLQSWEDTRQEFLANVSHELRSPLTTLRGMILAMKDQVVPVERQPHYLAICDTEVQRLQRLVDDLLDLASIQNGSGSLRLQRSDVIALSRQTIDLLAPVIESRGIRFEVWVPEIPESTMFVQLDEDRYAQILNNLLYNAMKFTPENGCIWVHLGFDADSFIIEVRDSGIGMSPEELERIWDRFYKADPSRAGGDQVGTGLGLTIVKHLVQRMSGSIQAESAPGEGTAFTLRLPLMNRMSS